MGACEENVSLRKPPGSPGSPGSPWKSDGWGLGVIAAPPSQACSDGDAAGDGADGAGAGWGGPGAANRCDGRGSVSCGSAFCATRATGFDAAWLRSSFKQEANINHRG
eukprot:scaffold27134_cov23-Prasinocladus_malaysianus.AAC.1